MGFCVLREQTKCGLALFARTAPTRPVFLRCLRRRAGGAAGGVDTGRNRTVSSRSPSRSMVQTANIGTPRGIKTQDPLLLLVSSCRPLSPAPPPRPPLTCSSSLSSSFGLLCHFVFRPFVEFEFGDSWGFPRSRQGLSVASRLFASLVGGGGLSLRRRSGRNIGHHAVRK